MIDPFIIAKPAALTLLLLVLIIRKKVS